jgi:hypothetical protein
MTAGELHQDFSVLRGLSPSFNHLGLNLGHDLQRKPGIGSLFEAPHPVPLPFGNGEGEIPE